jgi:hypothetical protein
MLNSSRARGEETITIREEPSVKAASLADLTPRNQGRESPHSQLQIGSATGVRRRGPRFRCVASPALRFCGLPSQRYRSRRSLRSAIKKRPPHREAKGFRVLVSSWDSSIDCELKKQVLAPQGVSEKAMRDFPMLTRKDPSKYGHDEVALLMS